MIRFQIGLQLIGFSITRSEYTRLTLSRNLFSYQLGPISHWITPKIAISARQALGKAADRWLNAIKDGVSESRRARVLAEVGAYFHADCALELKRSIGFALAVKEDEDQPR